jgi:hypothetical protein
MTTFRIVVLELAAGCLAAPRDHMCQGWINFPLHLKLYDTFITNTIKWLLNFHASNKFLKLLSEKSLSVLQFFLFVFQSLSHGAVPFSWNRYLCSYLRSCQHFMVPEASISCLQDPSIGSYPEPDPSSPYHPILSLYDPF